MASFRTLDDLGDVRGKRALVRVDLNVPMADLEVTDDTRLRATVPTVTELADKGAIILLLAHFGRPKGEKRPDMSLSLVTRSYEEVLGRPVRFVGDCIGETAKENVAQMQPGDVAILENTRFHPGEEKNDAELARGMAELGDFYVDDAFSAAHRAHASTEALAHLLPAYAGRAMEAELKALQKALGEPERPVAAVVGGAKVSTKLEVLRHLVAKVDHLIIGGGMANTFLAARGVDVGKSLCEHDLKPVALEILEAAERARCTVHLPYDVVVAKEFAPDPPSLRTANVHEVGPDEMILDIGPAAVEALADVLKTCRTLVWNGPLGAFETPPFDRATVQLAQTAAALTQGSQLVSVAGGGDTVAALNHAGAADGFTFVSTAGGAFLEWMEGKELPGVKALEGEMIRLAAIDHVVFRVADLDASLRFYTEVLGATVEKVQSGIGLWQLRAGTSLIDLVPLDGALGRMGGAGPGEEGRNVDHVCFRIADWDEAAIVGHLARHGIAAELAQRYGAEGDGPSLYLRDPDGNGLELKGPPARAI